MSIFRKIKLNIMILINTIGKNLDKLDHFNKRQFKEIIFLVSSNEKQDKNDLKKEINSRFRSINFEFRHNLIEVKTDDINEWFNI